LPGGRSPHLKKAHSGFRKGERASDGRGCTERGTLNADRKVNRKGARLFNALHSCRGQQEPASETTSSCHSQLRRNNVQAILGRNPIARPISWPSPWSSGCRQFASKGWDRGIDSHLQGRVGYGLPSCHWHTRPHRMLCLRLQDGPGTWRRREIARETDPITSAPVGEKGKPVCVAPPAVVLAPGKVGLWGATEQQTALRPGSGSEIRSFCRTMRSAMPEAGHIANSRMNNWFVKSKFGFLPP
jgi:hypothetical protein